MKLTELLSVRRTRHTETMGWCSAGLLFFVGVLKACGENADFDLGSAAEFLLSLHREVHDSGGIPHLKSPPPQL